MLDLSFLAQPISDEQACGSDIRVNASFDSLYAHIKDERFLARRLEREQSEESPKPHWKKVYDFAVKILTEQSKDLQVTCWLTEAAVRLYGFDGLFAAINLVRLLIEKFWEQLYPLIDEDGFDSRIAGFVGLNGDTTEGTLIFPLLNIPLTQGKSVISISTWQFQHIKNLGKEQQPQKIEPTDLNEDILSTSIKETPKDFFVSLSDTLTQTLNEIDLLDAVLTDKCGDNSPSFGEIKKILLTSSGCLKIIAPFLLQTDTTSSFVNEERDSTNPSLSTDLQNQRINDRESAFQNLIEISNFFQRSEPHSPVPYLLRKAVRWGNTPLTDLFRELVEDKNVLAHIYNLTGMEDSTKESNN